MSDTPKLNAAFYGRYSAGPNQSESSIEGQRRECYARAKSQNTIIRKDYIDRHISGQTDQRPQFQQLMKDVKKGLLKSLNVFNQLKNNNEKRKLMFDNYKTIYLNLPYKVNGFIMYDSADDYYTIVLNSRSTYKQNKRTFEHEIQHIINNDFAHNRNVGILEASLH